MATARSGSVIGIAVVACLCGQLLATCPGAAQNRDAFIKQLNRPKYLQNFTSIVDRNKFDPSSPSSIENISTVNVDKQQLRESTFLKIKDKITQALRDTTSTKSLRETLLGLKSDLNDNSTGLTDDDRDDLAPKMHQLEAKLAQQEHAEEQVNALAAMSPESHSQRLNVSDPITDMLSQADCAAIKDALPEIHTRFIATQSAEKIARNFSSAELTLNPAPMCEYFDNLEQLYQGVLDAIQKCPSGTKFGKGNIREVVATYVISARQQKQTAGCQAED